ncbi:MAG: chemotaxis-specific protein-glutamate methyltransferase CheB [Candidatus Ozemobacteraceae bacterium]
MGLRVLIVDDSLLFRKILSDVLARISDVEIVGNAPNGKIALEKTELLNPDLITLDMEMPEMNGLQFYTELRKKRTSPGVIVLSAINPAGDNLSMKTLELGAFDFVPKPVTESMEESKNVLFSSLQPVIQAFIQRLGIRSLLGSAQTPAKQVSTPDVSHEVLPPTLYPPRDLKCWGKADLIVIGISTGGPLALHKIFSTIRVPLSVPLLIVQHIPPSFSQALAESLREKHQLSISEAINGELLESGKVYLAPGGKHMKIGKDPALGLFRIFVTNDHPENNCRPSIDYLLRSIALYYPGKTAVFIMTGMGNDGATGAGLIRRGGGLIVAQDEKSSVVFGMPKAVFETGVVDAVISLDLIPKKIQELAGDR